MPRAVLFALVSAACVWLAAGAQCASCRYKAWNCSTDATDDTTANYVAVCDAAGKIQVDDVFCNDGECQCADDHQCVSLSLGCKNLFQARNRRRCVSAAGMQGRFESCNAGGALTTTSKLNLAKDWVYFRSATKCQSTDCQVVRRFEACGVVQCGRLVVAWKDATQYHFVVDGSRASDMSPGTFHFAGALTGDNACSAITSEKITHCHAIQTRNQKDGKCDGVYLQLDQSFKANGDYNMRELEWSVWLTVVGCVVGAIASVAAVGIMIYRGRKQSSSGEDAVDLDESAGITAPENNSPDVAEDNATVGQSPSSTTDLRQRGTHP